MITAGDHDGPETIAGPTTVDESGTYVFGDDLSADGKGIEVTASDVTIDGRGHQLAGDGQGAGIQIRGGARDVTVRNLTVRDFRRGVDVRWGSSLTLASVTIEGNAADGVRSGGETTVACEGSTVRRNGGCGIDVYDGDVSIRGCEIRENAEQALGSDARATVVVEDSVAADNGGAVLLPATDGSRIERTLIEANDGPGLETAPADRSPIEASGGLSLWTAPIDDPPIDEPVPVRRCDVRDNAGPGIEHTNGFLEVRGCTLVGNEVGYRVRAGDEFEALLRHNVIEDNEEGGAVADPASAPKSIDATCNWWGDETGPRHRDNPLDDPTGQSVSDRVQFLPWSTERFEFSGRSADSDHTDDSDQPDGSDRTADLGKSCVGGLETDESAVGYVSRKSYRRIAGDDPYDADCWDETFYLTDPSDVDRDGHSGPGAILVGDGERLVDGHVIRAESDAVPVTLPTWGGERGNCESLLFVELNQPLFVDRAYRIAAVHDPSPYREDVDTNGFAGSLNAVVRVTFEPVESDASADDATPLR